MELIKVIEERIPVDSRRGRFALRNVIKLALLSLEIYIPLLENFRSAGFSKISNKDIKTFSIILTNYTLIRESLNVSKCKGTGREGEGGEGGRKMKNEKRCNFAGSKEKEKKIALGLLPLATIFFATCSRLSPTPVQL